MKMKWMCLVVLFLLVGCAAVRQGITDYQTGKTTPIAEGEKSPTDMAKDVIGLVADLPVVGNYSGYLLPILVGFFTWKRGKNIRNGREYKRCSPMSFTSGAKVYWADVRILYAIQDNK